MIPACTSSWALLKDRIVIGASNASRWTFHVPPRQPTLGDTAVGILAVKGSGQA